MESIEINIDEKDREIAIELKDVYFQYNNISEPTIRDLSFKVIFLNITPL